MQTGDTMDKRTHGQNQEGGWKQGREVGLAEVGRRGGEKMQTTVIEQQLINFKKFKKF